jgi:glycosyltransferase involved in cell wall biosynthesis
MVEGGHMVIARELVRALREAGHISEILVTPQNRFGRQAAAYLATWLTDVGRADAAPIDQVISLRYPSYAVRHPNHVCWLNHTMREYYDQWDRFSESLSAQGRIKERVRRTLVHAADRYLLTRNVSKLFVQSDTIRRRLQIWPTLKAEVLYPPAPQRPYRCDAYDDHLFIVSRLTPLKRVDLAIEALATAQAAGIRCVIAGDGEEQPRLRGLIERLGLSNRVTLVGHVTDEQLVDHLSRCRAVCFPTLAEDYGLVTPEAFAAGKAVITCSDSGGPAELVENGVQGLVCEPTPDSLGSAMRSLMEDRALAERMGQAAREAGSRLNWPDVVRRLTSWRQAPAL